MLNISDFHHFKNVYISQGSVATQLRCGGENNKYFIANSLLNPVVKKFKIGQHLAKLLTKNIVGLFLTHTACLPVLKHETLSRNFRDTLYRWLTMIKLKVSVLHNKTDTVNL